MKPRTELGTEQRIGRPNRGSATFLALFTLALLTFIGATVLVSVTRRYNGNEKAQGWQEALQAAEAGADVGLQNVRWLATAASTPFDTTLGWTKDTSDPTNTVYTYTTPTITGTGEGTAQTWAVVTVDGPPQLVVSGNQWYRIRSIGHAKLSGLARVSNDVLTDPNGRNKNSLRKFSLIRDRSTGTTLAAPEATRTIEEIVKPKSGFTAGLQALNSLSISGNQIIDSYDPTDPNKSTNGLYDPAKRQSNGTVGVGGTLDGTNIASGSKALTIGSGENVYGNATTNGGSFTDPNSTIQSPGTISNTTNNNFPSVPVPNWGTPGNPPINNSVTTISKAQTITLNSDPTQNYYKIDKINGPLTVALGAGMKTGTLNIWLTTGMNVQGAMTIPVGVTVKVYLQGDQFHPGESGANIASIDNQNHDPAYFQLYGVGYSNASGGGGIDLHAGDSAPGIPSFYGIVYAPERAVLLKYMGKTNYDTTNAFYGAVVGSNVTAQGSFHYDEALSTIGTPVDYFRASYVEDPR